MFHHSSKKRQRKISHYFSILNIQSSREKNNKSLLVKCARDFCSFLFDAFLFLLANFVKTTQNMETNGWRGIFMIWIVRDWASHWSNIISRMGTQNTTHTRALIAWNVFFRRSSSSSIFEWIRYWDGRRIYECEIKNVLRRLCVVKPF